MSDAGNLDLPPPAGDPARPDLPPPVPAAAPPATAPTATAPTGDRRRRRRTCEICGRAPALVIDARKFTGYALVGRSTFWKGNACRDCATTQYREGLSHCLLRGWWGVLALPVNPFMILKNALGLRAAGRLGEPQGRPLADPLPSVAPVLRRPTSWIGLAVPVLVVAAVVAGVVALGDDEPPGEDFAVGDCIDLPDSGLARPSVVPCGTRHRAEVTGLRDVGAGADGDALCAAESTDYLGGPNRASELRPAAILVKEDGEPRRVLCLVVSADGSRLVGSQRGSGR